MVMGLTKLTILDDNLRYSPAYLEIYSLNILTFKLDNKSKTIFNQVKVKTCLNLQIKKIVS